MILPRPSLVTIYKSFIRSHLEYRDIVFDQAFNKWFHDNLESIQYNASLAMTGAIRGTSKGKLYQELAFESLQQRRWFHKLCTFFRIYKNQSLSYLFNLIPLQTSSRITGLSNNMPCFLFKHKFFKNSFFLSLIIEWNNLHISIPILKNLSTFRKSILQFIRHSPSRTYYCFSNKGIKHIARFCLGLSHLRKHKLKHGFLNSLNPICSCGLDTETTCHY